MDENNSQTNNSPAQGNLTNSSQGGTGIDDRTMSILSHVLGLLTGFIGPLVIWLIQKEKGGPAVDHAKEALNFQITMVLGSVVAFALTFIVIGFLLIPVIMVLNLVYSIKGAIAASNGESYKYPVSWRIIQ